MNKLLLAIAATSLVSCYCWQSAHKQEPMCVVAHQTLDCSTAETEQALRSLGPLVSWLLAGANGAPNWDELLHSLELAGFKDAMCIMAALENDFFSKAASPAGAKVHENYKAYMFKYHPGLKLRMNKVAVQ